MACPHCHKGGLRSTRIPREQKVFYDCLSTLFRAGILWSFSWDGFRWLVKSTEKAPWVAWERAQLIEHLLTFDLPEADARRLEQAA